MLSIAPLKSREARTQRTALTSESRRMRRLSPRRDTAMAFMGAKRVRGAVLLEVVLALLLFVAAAAVITGGIHASLTSVERMRLTTHAANLAVSVMSELQLGIRSTSLSGPESFDPPFENWTWELVAAPAELDMEETTPWTQVEVIIRHPDPALTFRVSQLIQPSPAAPAGGTASEEPLF
jgi:type II secretory pathway pseudopilin PulG